MARRRYQNGCVFLRGKKWVLRYRVDAIQADGNLTRIHRSIVLGPFTRKKDAWQAAQVHLNRVNIAACQPQVVMSFAEFWDRYFIPEVLPTVKTSTRKLYMSLAKNHILPCLGDRRLDEIHRVEIQHFVVGKHQQGYSVQTVAHLRNLLSKVFETVRSWGWHQDNPARGVKLSPMERVRIARVLSVEEIEQLTLALQEPVRTMVFLGVTLGLRIGELLALRLEDVDLARSKLYIRRDVYRGSIQTPKTKRSEREFELSTVQVNWVREYLMNRTVSSDWLFPSTSGTILDDRNLIRRYVRPVCDRLAIRPFSWHSLRHTFATIAENHGVPVSVAQALLGHTNPTTTMIYAHALKGPKREAVEKVTGILFPNVPKVAQVEMMTKR